MSNSENENDEQLVENTFDAFSTKITKCNGVAINDAKSKGKEKIRKRAPRDENAPKPPMSAYVFYIRENTRSCKNSGDFKKVAYAWRTMTDEEKKSYVDQSNVDRLKYKKDMEEYKKSDAYHQFLREKKSIAKKIKISSSSEVNGIQVFSKEFLEYNKTRESTLRKLRREIGDLEEEIEEIEQKILPLNTEFDNAQRFAFEFESQYNNSEKLLEKWRKTTLKAMEDAKLLSHFHLSLNSNMEELVIKLEEAAKKHDSFSNSLKLCLSNINYVS